MKGDPPADLDYLLAYYRGAYFATVALKDRVSKLGPECVEAVRKVGEYQRMVEGYGDALKQTAAMHAGSSPIASSEKKRS